MIGLLGALPSLVWAVSRPVLIHDDWWLADVFASGSAADRWQSFVDAATQAPARPGGSLYYLVSYGLFGRHAWLHALLLAAVNAALCILVFIVAEKLWQSDVALWVAGFYAVMPNRGSTRLWFAVGNYPLAMIFVLLGVLLLLKSRPIWAGLIMAAGVLTYEGVAGLALFAVVAWVLASWRERWKLGLGALVPIGSAAILLYLMSPKRDGSSVSLGGFDRMLASQFGVGMYESSTIAGLVFIAVAVGVVVVAGFPGPWRERYRPPVLWGVAILLAGWLPFAVTRWPIGTDGFFDRANGVVGLGTAVICGALLACLADRAPAHVGAAIGVVALVGLFALNAKDVGSYFDARSQGDALLAQVITDIEPTDAAILVIPIGEASNGVEQFPFGINLSSAVAVERGDRLNLWVNPEIEPARLPDDHICYDRAERAIVTCPDSVGP